MDKLVVDSSAWIEYFKGGTKGNTVKKYVDTHILFTSGFCIGEITATFLRYDMPLDVALSFLKVKGTVVLIDFSIAENAGRLYHELRKKNGKISLSDAVTLAIAKKIGAKILTFDNDFRGIPEAIVL
ncbi:PIN domain-containing protein [Candidatus Woesearchaeota archaeon]|nr:PIN domain-containing protein [Candidatus Woesearchaeota archaeon]